VVNIGHKLSPEKLAFSRDFSRDLGFWCVLFGYSRKPGRLHKHENENLAIFFERGTKYVARIVLQCVSYLGFDGSAKGLSRVTLDDESNGLSP